MHESQQDLDEWRKHVDGQIRAVKEQLNTTNTKLETNTRLTEEVKLELVGVKESVTDLVNKTEPITSALDSMQAGIKTIGKIGRFGAVAGKWAIRVAVVSAAVWVAVKVLAGGGSLMDATAAFWRVMSIGH